jgi:hypothetical protein
VTREDKWLDNLSSRRDNHPAIQRGGNPHKEATMEPRVTKPAEAQDEREWELADEDLDRVSVRTFSNSCANGRFPS